MSFFVNGLPVFLPLSQEQKLRQEVLNDFSPLAKIGALTAGSNLNKTANKLITNYLKNKYKENPTQFYIDWVYFDIVGKEASVNVWHLLSDYCYYYGYAYLSDFRNFIQKLEDDYLGDTLSYPMGEIFTLNHFVKPKKWWWKYTSKMNGRVISIIISVKKVTHLVGDLSDFEIYTEDYLIRCRKNLLTILPLQTINS